MNNPPTEAAYKTASECACAPSQRQGAFCACGQGAEIVPRQPSAVRDARVIPRRSQLNGSAGGVASACAPILAFELQPPKGSDAIPAIGSSVLDKLDTERLDARIRRFMAANLLPNGALAIVAADGRLVYAKGFTCLAAYDRARAEPFYAGPDTRFRIAGLSKVLTGLAAIKVFSEWRLHPSALDARLGELVDLDDFPWPLREAGLELTLDPRLQDIRLRHLLGHSAGWVSEAPERDGSGVSVDPEQVWPAFPWSRRADLSPQADLTDAYDVVSTYSFATLPLTPLHLLRYGNTRRLSWDPGDYVSHSNYGYWLAGLAIEAATCRSYESVVQEVFLVPLGMEDTWPGSCDRRERLVGEVPYFAELWPWQDGAVRDVVFHSVHDGSFTAPDLPPAYLPYATWDLRLGLATGGWVSSVHDLALLCRELFGGVPSTLTRASVILGLLRATSSSETSGWTLSGLECKRVGSATAYEKSGRLSGTMAWLYNYGDRPEAPGVSVIYLFNRTTDALAEGREARFRRGLVGSSGAVTAIRRWGTADLLD